MRVTMIVAAPLLLWYDKSRFLQDYFDIVRHIPAAAIDPKESGFLKAILKRRGADKLMSAAAMSDICRFSGGVLRDLLELAQSAAQYAYRDAEDRIVKQHVRAAIRQLGNRYLAGVGTTRTRLIRRLLRDKQFFPTMQTQRTCWSAGKSLNTLVAGAPLSSSTPLWLNFCPSGHDDFLSRHPLSSCKNSGSGGSAESCNLPAAFGRARPGTSGGGGSC